MSSDFALFKLEIISLLVINILLTLIETFSLGIISSIIVGTKLVRVVLEKRIFNDSIESLNVFVIGIIFNNYKINSYIL